LIIIYDRNPPQPTGLNYGGHHTQLEREAKARIASNLNQAKTSNADIYNNKGLSHYKFGENANRVLSVISKTNNLPYPTTLSERNRDRAFLPRNYAYHALDGELSNALAQYIRTKDWLQDQDRLIKYLSPLAYLVRQDLRSLVDSLPNIGSYIVSVPNHSKIIDGLRERFNQHTYIIGQPAHKLAGLNADETKTTILNLLVNHAFHVLSQSNETIREVNGHRYYFGKNHLGQLSVIVPGSGGLSYPLLYNERFSDNAVMPQGFVVTPQVEKQWNRLNLFLEDGFAPDAKARMKILLKPIASLSAPVLSNMVVDMNQVSLLNIINLLSVGNVNQQDRGFFQALPQNIFGGNVVNDLRDLESKSSYHTYMTNQGWPNAYRDDRNGIAGRLINYLLYNELESRFKTQLGAKVDQYMNQFGAREILPVIGRLQAIGYRYDGNGQLNGLDLDF
jgi:hypothetical protein